jgi:hypothetical protein
MFNLPENKSRELEMYLTDFSILSNEYKLIMTNKSPRHDFIYDCDDLKDKFKIFGNSKTNIKIIEIKISELCKFISDVENL